MGVLQDSMIPDCNGVLKTDHLDTSSLYLNHNFASISSESWRIAEQATQHIILQIQPTLVSEERRKAVVDYVQRLIKAHMGSVVLPFGSVPLKTYLPDGDIDLTAFGNSAAEDTLTNELSVVLEREEQNNEAEFVVRDVQVINAEVKLVKCLVQNIVVDISFNQLGGLCTLCFLEKIDRLIGKDHLFKRSIILIKAWCYYESRILGAHHGLISTYALETMVLYIFHLFHSSLNGPLAVLYRFLDYFSTFDWDNYCISLNGLIHVSSLPDITVERSDNASLPLLLSAEFLRECVSMFSVPVRPNDTLNSRYFLRKFLNIVDPLKEKNNLGRSVSKGNAYRIRSAFTYGVRKLGHILSQSEETIFDELPKFFMNTLDRHRNGQRPDVQDVLLVSDFNGNGSTMPSDNFQDDDMPLIPRDSEDASTNGFRRLKTANDLASCPFKSEEKDTFVSGKAHHAPHLYFANHSTEKGNSIYNKEAVGASNCDNGKMDTPDERAGTLVACSQNSCHGNHECAAVASTSGEDEGSCLNRVSDLSVEHDVHFQYLCYGRWWHDHYLSGAPTIPQASPLQSHNKNQWSPAGRPIQIIQTPYSHNGIVHAQFFTMPPNMIPGSVFGVEDFSKPRGTGTYFPDMNHQLNRMRSASRGRNHMMLRSNSSRTLSSSESAAGILDWGSNLPATMRNSVERGNNSADYRHSCSPRRRQQQQQAAAEKMVEFGSFSQLHLGLPPTPNNRHQSNNTLSSPTPGFQRKPIQSASVSNEDRRSSYRLKDEVDFPPLSPFGGGSCDTKKYENGT